MATENNFKILYIDDEEDIREVVEFALEDEGFDLRLAGSGQQALDCLREFLPDMILLDVMMPGLDGPGTLLELRQIPGLEKIPVVFCTAKAHPDEITQLEALGAVRVIPKPFDAMGLADHIRAIWESLDA